MPSDGFEDRAVTTMSKSLSPSTSAYLTWVPNPSPAAAPESVPNDTWPAEAEPAAPARSARAETRVGSIRIRPDMTRAPEEAKRGMDARVRPAPPFATGARPSVCAKWTIRDHGATRQRGVGARARN